MVWEDLGISSGTAIIVLIALYFVIKWAVKNGIKEALGIKDGMEKVDFYKVKEQLKGEKNKLEDFMK
ncbi:MAG: DUF6019 family protein [Clostridium sp.]|uniref:DUF6019 family protein n=1 Tax=Clostridium culturomicium TaxID=1499683 RepID=UPI00058D8A32|nr:DUF6019 family protein [Clostridium culturomicium]MDU4892084.1 DUF6019 family protein [Clostridium sp.]MDU7082471.1 DUF6019 family protein [Clostridium sp.]